MRAHRDPAEILQTTGLVDRFLRYVQIDTQSSEESDSCPSTAKQLDLARLLAEELTQLGLSEVELDENGYVLATLEGSGDMVLGLCAHLDTAPAFSGTQVKPQMHEDYDGTAISLKNGVVVDSVENPELLECLGDTIITSDGTTLLGADDKSGIAAIMSMLEILKRDPSIAHPTLKICFNPDEEIGRGPHRFPLERFAADLCFTVDGGFPGEMNVETFSADKAMLKFTGVSVHPGTARGKMVNALTWLGKFLDRLPWAESPECTHEKEGFYHPTAAKGDAAECSLELILRDFDTEQLKLRGQRLRAMAEGLMAEEPKLRVEVAISEQYRNMHDDLAKHPKIAETLRQAIEATGLTPRTVAVRGGTDGSQLTAMGLPTPNLFAGGMNFHGPKEWVSDRAMALATATLLNLVQIYAEEPAISV